MGSVDELKGLSYGRGMADIGWQMRVANGVIRLRTRWNSSFLSGTAATVQEHLVWPESFAPPKRCIRGLDISVRHIGTVPVYVVRPPDGSVDRRVVFFHGGGYCFEINSHHWRLIAHLARHAKAEVVVPIYPLAPISTAEHTVDFAADLVDDLIQEAEPVVAMGDSAGGGLVLAAAQVLRERGRQPSRLVLISPWLDVTISDPRSIELDPLDLMLGIEGTRDCGRLYAGELDLRDPRVSPLFGDLDGLAPIDVFTGTHDILNPDARRLVEQAEGTQTVVTMHEVVGAQHDYPLFPVVPDSVKARKTLVELVLSA